MIETVTIEAVWNAVQYDNTDPSRDERLSAATGFVHDVHVDLETDRLFVDDEDVDELLPHGYWFAYSPLLGIHTIFEDEEYQSIKKNYYASPIVFPADAYKSLYAAGAINTDALAWREATIDKSSYRVSEYKVVVNGTDEEHMLWCADGPFPYFFNKGPLPCTAQLMGGVLMGVVVNDPVVVSAHREGARATGTRIIEKE